MGEQTEGELKKRLRLHTTSLWAGDPTDEIRDFNEIVDTVNKEFPCVDRLDQAIDMFKKIFNVNHGFSSRYILSVLQETRDAKKKWFGNET